MHIFMKFGGGGTDWQMDSTAGLVAGSRKATLKKVVSGSLVLVCPDL